MHGNNVIDERGFTLIEVLVSLSILSVALFGLLSMIGSTSKAIEVGKRQTQALNLASEKLELLKSVPYVNINISGNGTQAGDDQILRTCVGPAPSYECTPTTDNPATLGSASYTWKWYVTFLDLDNDGVLVPDPTDFPDGADRRDIKKIDVEVGWTDSRGDHTLTLSTLRNI